MKPCLIVYYSRTGTTAKVARSLARLCAADIEEIIDTRDRKGVRGFLRSLYEALRGATPDIAECRYNPADYALTILATPVWAGRMSSPLRSYVVKQRARLRHVAVLACMGGANGAPVLAAVAELCGKQPLAQLSLKQGDIEAARHEAALAAFAAQLSEFHQAEPAPA